MRVTFLGTGGGVPTSKRNLLSIAVRRENELLLFDVGEGTQRQMIFAKVGCRRNMKVFITHMHGDHILGLPGLIQTMSMLNRGTSLDVYGPHGIVEFVDFIVNSFHFNLTFQINTHEVGEGTIYEDKDYSICATWGDHVIPNLAYALVEKKRMGRFYLEKALKLGVPKGPLWSRLQHGENVQLPDGRVIKSSEVTGPKRAGRKIVYSGDTKFSENIIKLAQGADLLIHEATLDDDYVERASEEGHSTSSQAAMIAKKAGVKKLLLIHISARYIDDVSIMVEQARKIFPETYVAEDLMSIEVPLKD
jgi:ribonuclease Z